MTDPLQAGFDRFGNSVAVQGNVAVVGAWFTYGSQYGGPGPIGAAYIFSA